MKTEKLILAIETAVGQGSISLSMGGREIGHRRGEKQVTRSMDLLSEISELLTINNFEKNDIDLIAVSTGPGSYTGARIGIATAKALAYALDRPCLGVSVLEALANSFKQHKSVCPAVSVGRENLYFQFFEYEDDRKAKETNVFFGDSEELSSQIQKFKPELIALSGIERNVSEKIKFNLTPALEKTQFEFASDNNSRIIALFINLEMEDREMITLKDMGEIQPIYIREEAYKKIAELKDSDN